MSERIWVFYIDDMIGFASKVIVKLASNENPLGCSDRVKQAVAAELAEIGRYPDGGGFILKDQICQQTSKIAVEAYWPSRSMSQH